MPKTQEELNQLKAEYETLTTKLKELTEDELNEIVGGGAGDWMERMKKMLEDYYSNSKSPTKEIPSHLLPGIDPNILDNE